MRKINSIFYARDLPGLLMIVILCFFLDILCTGKPVQFSVFSETVNAVSTIKLAESFVMSKCAFSDNVRKASHNSKHFSATSTW